jgi:5-formyltetrahydrofolate cyclo-ligase
MTDTQSIKTQLRRELRRCRHNLSSSVQQLAARSLAGNVAELTAWPNAKRIALYKPADGEIDTGPLEKLARSEGKQLFLPVIDDDNHLNFTQWRTGGSFLTNRFNIPEPDEEAFSCEEAGLDIIFLPLVGWDRRGGRLGMGGGFYDRTLANVSGPLLVGLAHACQEVEEIPRDNWDVALDFIATDSGLYRREAE